MDVHLEELDDHTKISEEGFKVISQQEYVSRLHELKDEITRAWHNDDRVTALKLSIKVRFVCPMFWFFVSCEFL